jgi:hypothetical protein
VPPIESQPDDRGFDMLRVALSVRIDPAEAPLTRRHPGITAAAVAFGIACTSPALARSGDPRIPAHAQIGKTVLADAKFEFMCTTGEGGALAISLIVPHPDQAKGFPLDRFEGPDGIGETRDLAEWSVSGSAKPARARTSISGWYGVDGDGWIFSRARESARSSDIARIAKQFLSSDNARLRLVVKAPAHKEALKVEAPIAGHREEIAKALEACLAHVK